MTIYGIYSQWAESTKDGDFQTVEGPWLNHSFYTSQKRAQKSADNMNKMHKHAAPNSSQIFIVGEVRVYEGDQS